MSRGRNSSLSTWPGSRSRVIMQMRLPRSMSEFPVDESLPQLEVGDVETRWKWMLELLPNPETVICQPMPNARSSTYFSRLERFCDKVEVLTV